ncbi:MAG TPA: choice-of-anchor R domain-containing protein [Candidatus Paceibacterota bacterium]|jgi:hypothetical protein
MNLKPVRGYVLLLTLVFFGVFLSLSAALMAYVLQYSQSGKYALAATQALYLAESGIEVAAYELNRNSGYTGESDTPLGAGAVSIEVSSVDSSTKAVTVTASVPYKGTEVRRTVQAKLGINSSVVSFRFGVQVGEGGVTMANGSRINGNLYSNGDITGGGNAIVTGDATVAGGTQATPSQSSTVQSATVNLGDATARTSLAQSFRPSSSQAINKVSLYLRKVGTPGDLTIRIMGTTSGSPNTTVLASGTLPASSVSGTFSFVDATFSSSPTLSSGQTYWLVATASVNASNYFTWGSDASDAYANGTGKRSSSWSGGSSSWTALAQDLAFKAWMGGVTTSLSGIQVWGNVWAPSLSSCQVSGNAMYQTMSGCSIGGVAEVTSDTAAPASMPIADAQIAEWEDIASDGGTIVGDYAITGTQLLGPKAINGNLTVSGAIYLTGPVWVKGNVTFANNSSMIVHSSTGSNGAIIIADKEGSESTSGRVTLSNNMTIAGNGNAGSYPMIISTNTSSNAVTMSNNSTSVILYAPDGTVNILNNAAANQISAKSLNLNNNVTVNYVNGLQSQSFSNGPGGSWAFLPGSYAIVP